MYWAVIDEAEAIAIHGSGVLDFLLDHMAFWVGGLRKVGINFQVYHIGLHAKKPSF